MTINDDNRQTHRWRRTGSRALRILLALAFIGAGAFKITGQPAAVAEFAQVGIGQSLRYLTAVIEIAGAILLVTPRAIALGALALGTVCVGAFFAQVRRLHGDVAHTIVLAYVADDADQAREEFYPAYDAIFGALSRKMGRPPASRAEFVAMTAPGAALVAHINDILGGVSRVCLQITIGPLGRLLRLRAIELLADAVRSRLL